jgi:hypothetical protein
LTKLPTRPRSQLELFQFAGAPSLELVANVIWVPVCGYDNVQMIGPAAYRMELPATDSAMPGNRRFHELSLLHAQDTGLFAHAGLRFELPDWIG